jgi:hypothetical protein
MTIRIDWKFWLVLAATVAGVLVPVWLWRADLDARSLHIRKISQTSLQPPDTAKSLDLHVFAGGAELTNAYVTVFELINDGTRPVPAGDFESPLEIYCENNAEIIRASLTKVTPPDLAPTVGLENGSVRIKPTLLNPGDSMTLAIITTKNDPTFSSRARIAGVRTVPIIEEQKKSGSPLLTVLAAIAILTSMVSVNLVFEAWPSSGVTLRPRASFVVFLVATCGAAIPLTSVLPKIGIDGVWPSVGVYTACFLLTNLLAKWLNRSTPESISTTPIR